MTELTQLYVIKDSLEKRLKFLKQDLERIESMHFVGSPLGLKEDIISLENQLSVCNSAIEAQELLNEKKDDHCSLSYLFDIDKKLKEISDFETKMQLDLKKYEELYKTLSKLKDGIVSKDKKDLIEAKQNDTDLSAISFAEGWFKVSDEKTFTKEEVLAVLKDSKEASDYIIAEKEKEAGKPLGKIEDEYNKLFSKYDVFSEDERAAGLDLWFYKKYFKIKSTEHKFIKAYDKFNTYAERESDLKNDIITGVRSDDNFPGKLFGLKEDK